MTQRDNLSSVVFSETTEGIVVSSFANRTNLPRQPYDAKNIVLLSDGVCSLACATFVELMHYQAGSARTTPPHYEFQDLPADCRIFYTVATVYNFENLWNYVIDAMWRNPSLCMAGSATPFAPSTASNSPASAPAKLSERSTEKEDISLLEARAFSPPSISECTVCSSARETCSEYPGVMGAVNAVSNRIADLSAPAKETVTEHSPAPGVADNAAFVRRVEM
ncbi:MAG: hypothetical protein Q9207_002745 [Kuettlingeria erythrocarpa]